MKIVPQRCSTVTRRLMTTLFAVTAFASFDRFALAEPTTPVDDAPRDTVVYRLEPVVVTAVPPPRP
jgi:hypothetical protein